MTVWDSVTHSRVTDFHAHPIGMVDVSPDGKGIATGSFDTTAYAWSLHTGERLLGPLKHNGGLAAVKYSLDGCPLATATDMRHSVHSDLRQPAWPPLC